MSDTLMASDARYVASIEGDGLAVQYSADHPAIRRLSQIHRDMDLSFRCAPPAYKKHLSQSDCPKDALRIWRSTARKTLAVVATVSLFANVLMLTMPIYLFQISDRLLTNQSLDRLLMVSGLALGLLATMWMLDILRRRILGRLAARMEITLGDPILASILMSAPTSESGNVQALRFLHQVRSFLSSPTMLFLFDAPLSPFYFGAIFLIHRDLGAITLVAGLILFAIAVSGASKFACLVMQMAILGWGAHLALNGELTGGMMIAASIIAGRALQPLEGMIEGWRSLVQTRRAYARVCATLEGLQKEKSKLRLPRHAGRQTVERLPSRSA